MIVRSEDFVPRPPSWEDDPSVSAELKQELRERGMADPLSRVECLEIVDECFNCGEKLTTPYIYWQGATGNLSLHAKCAAKLALGLSQDAFQNAHGAGAKPQKEVVSWLEHLAVSRAGKPDK